jgi:RNA polymerase sigma factor (sigma-70 family)
MVRGPGARRGGGDAMTPFASRRRAARSGTPLSDPEIMARLARADNSALGEMYDRYREPVRRFVARATSDAEDVDDLVQATFLQVANSAARYDGRPCCRPWLIGIAAQLLRRRRQRFKRLVAALASFSAGLRMQDVDPRSMLDARSDLEQALCRISEPKRVTFLLAEVERLSCAEIAVALDVPIGTVWTRLHAARRELRRALQEDA